MKKHLTKKQRSYIRCSYRGKEYLIPISVASLYEVPEQKNKKEEDSVSVEEVFAELTEEYSQAGALLKGLRARENMTQAEFAEKIAVTQANLSKMENGKRPIGKIVAKRIANIFDIDYRCFLE